MRYMNFLLLQRLGTLLVRSCCLSVLRFCISVTITCQSCAQQSTVLCLIYVLLLLFNQCYQRRATVSRLGNTISSDNNLLSQAQQQQHQQQQQQHGRGSLSSSTLQRVFGSHVQEHNDGMFYYKIQVFLHYSTMLHLPARSDEGRSALASCTVVVCSCSVRYYRHR
jgi:hypothetical protein